MSEYPDHEGGIHLLLADDTVSAGHQSRRYLTQAAGDDDSEVVDYVIGECGHPAPLVDPVWCIGPCRERDPGAT